MSFSGARRTSRWERLRLTCTSIEKIECIGSWLRQRLITPVSQQGTGVALDPAEDEVNQDFNVEVIDDIEWFDGI